MRMRRDTLQNGAIGWHGGDKLLNKVIIFVFFVHKKYSRSFEKLQFNPEIALDFNIVRHFDGQGGKNSIIIYYYPSF